jgi:hypothetical protein
MSGCGPVEEWRYQVISLSTRATDSFILAGGERSFQEFEELDEQIVGGNGGGKEEVLKPLRGNSPV